MKNFTKYTKNFLFNGYKGSFYCLIPPFPTIIIIDPLYRYDVGLLKHEQMHLEQYKRNPFTYAFKMLFNKKFRLKSELECYAVQLLSYDESKESRERRKRRLAEILTKQYGINITEQDAYNLLEQEIKKVETK